MQLAAAQCTTHWILTKPPSALRRTAVGIYNDTRYGSFPSCNAACKGISMLACAFYSGSAQGVAETCIWKSWVLWSLDQTLRIRVRLVAAVEAYIRGVSQWPANKRLIRKLPFRLLTHVRKWGRRGDGPGLNNKQQEVDCIVSNSFITHHIPMQQNFPSSKRDGASICRI